MIVFLFSSLVPNFRGSFGWRNLLGFSVAALLFGVIYVLGRFGSWISVKEKGGDSTNDTDTHSRSTYQGQPVGIWQESNSVIGG
jgi:hypothetical protein